MTICNLCKKPFDISETIETFLFHACFNELTAEALAPPSPKSPTMRTPRQSPYYHTKRKKDIHRSLNANVVLEMYNRPLLINDIARELSVSKWQIRNCLMSLNVPPRTRSEVLRIQWAQGKYSPTTRRKRP